VALFPAALVFCFFAGWVGLSEGFFLVVKSSKSLNTYFYV
jgi:hypothetical protein